jgi:large subunit ribosomal protein L29
MKINDIRKLSDKELNDKIIETKRTLFDLRLKQSTGNLEKPSDLRELRKDVAKMKTVLKERELRGE